MKRHVVTVEPDESLLEAERIMRLARIRHLPVTRDGLLVGVLSHRDVVESSIGPQDPASPAERADHLRRISIDRILKRHPHTVEPDCMAQEAARLMLRLKIGCLPVVEPGAEGPTLVGLITESDLLELAYVRDYGESSD
ncbi:MAG: CBS domain-containing protein [Myxococcota bacterium]